nr:hypothetical protein [uncultured Shinella sp.]
MTTRKSAIDQKLRVCFYAIAEVTAIEYIEGERRTISKKEFFEIKVDDVPSSAFRNGKIPTHAIHMAEQKIIEMIDIKYYPNGFLKKWDLFTDPKCANRVSTYKRAN